MKTFLFLSLLLLSGCRGSSESGCFPSAGQAVDFLSAQVEKKCASWNYPKYAVKLTDFRECQMAVPENTSGFNISYSFVCLNFAEAIPQDFVTPVVD